MNCARHGYYLNVNGCPECSFPRVLQIAELPMAAQGPHGTETVWKGAFVEGPYEVGRTAAP